MFRVPYDAPFYVGGLLGNVTYNTTTGEIEKIHAIRLVYNMKHDPSEFNFYSIQLRDRMTEYLLNEYQPKLIKVILGSDDAFNQGLKVKLSLKVKCIFKYG